MQFSELIVAVAAGSFIGTPVTLWLYMTSKGRPWQRFVRHDTGPNARVQWSHADHSLSALAAVDPGAGRIASVVQVPEVGHLHDNGAFCLEDTAFAYKWRWTGHALQGRRPWGRRITIGPIQTGPDRYLPEIVAAALVADGERITGQRPHTKESNDRATDR